MATRDTVRPRPGKMLIVIGPRGIGDAVEAFPVFEIIREQWPDVYLVAASFSQSQIAMLEMSPHLSNRVMLFEEGSIKYAWRAIKGCRTNFNVMRGFDVILFLYKKVITWPMILTAQLTGAKVLYRHDYHYRDKRQDPYSDFPEHVFFQVVATRLLGLPLTRLREPRISLSDHDKRFGEDLFNRKGLGPRPVVILNTQSNPFCLGWGIERYACAANALAEWGADVLINGGADSQVAEFRSIAHKLRQRVFLLEKPSPRELASVTGQCDLHIGDPSGPSAVAIAVGTPTVILQGPGEHEYPGQDRTGPLWWPHDSTYELLSKIDWCQVNMGPQCKCRNPRREKHHSKRILKQLGLWDPWRTARKHLRTSLGIFQRRPETEDTTYPCLEAIRVAEVVEAAKRRLHRSPRRVAS
jgi:ADP-heptose:LPS heptosyltransferase